jgi:4-hydroxy-3-methylbut-2-enyl diphosphate reductase
MQKSIEIIKAKRAGFCFGVKRAVEMAFEAAKKGNTVYTLGPIIHNPQVVEKLKEVGVHPVDNLDSSDIKTIIIRTHGVPKELSDKLEEKGFNVIDATCPFVKKAQQYAKLLRDEGYQVVIVGDIEHPEVKGLMSYAGEDVIVVNKSSKLPLLKKKVGIIVQTTQPVDVFREIVSNVVGKVKELKVFNTICNSTDLRLRETKNMAKMVDIMIIVGGKNSANTTQLAELCRSMDVTTYHIETATEINNSLMLNGKKIGISAGASTPDWIIKEVENKIKNIKREGVNNGNNYEQRRK